MNEVLLRTIPRAPASITEETARRWMYYLGFHADHHKKGYYVDCHERGDVVFHREEFLPVMLDYETRSRHWTGQNMEIEHPPILREGEK